MQINGLTIFFADPDTLHLYHIPVALTEPTGKTAIELCRTSMFGLDRVGMKVEDLFKSMNENCTCTAAVKAVRL